MRLLGCVLALAVTLSVVLVAVLQPDAAAQPAAPKATRPATRPVVDKTLVLDRTGSFRQFVVFGLMPLSSEHLKAKGEKLFGAAGLQRLAKTVRTLLKHKGIDWKKTDWRDVACYHFASTQTADDTAAVQLLPTVFPPPGWMKAAFDDQRWLRQRLGTHNPVTPGFGAARERYSVHRRALYARTYFEVPDPAAAGDLRLKVAFRGGVRIFVNGAELTRAFLPAGDLGPSSLAEPYPREAYVSLEGEAPKRYAGFVGDLRCDFDKAPGHHRFKHPYRGAYGALSCVTRAGWNRLMRLRDRVLGPVTIPARMLRKGRNVLAIEIRTAPYHPITVPGAGDPKARNWAAGGANFLVMWDHLRLVDIDLRCPSGAVPSGVRRPAGAQAWVEDMHTRMFTPDFNPPGWPVGTARIVGAPNGAFGAQIAVGAGRDLTGLTAQCGALTGPAGQTIPAAAAKVMAMRGTSVGGMAGLGWFRCLGRGRGMSPMGNVAMWRYADRSGDIHHGELDEVYARKSKMQGPSWRALRDRVVRSFLSRFRFFDHVSATWPEKVPANTCQPLWLSLKVPADAAAGRYTGTVTIRAEGIKPLAVPVEVEVIPWRVPDAREFQTLVESEQSPYGVYNHYSRALPAKPGAKPRAAPPQPAFALWSDRHFELIATSFRQLARLGTDWVFVPVLLETELGNRMDSPIRWIRQADGTLGFDYAIMDRYLDLAVEHLGRPRVICFVVMHGCGSNSNAVRIIDETTGKGEIVDVGPTSTIDRRSLWRAFATSLHAHMRARGLGGSMYWGHCFDRTYDPALIPMLKEFCPDVYWAAGAHGRKPGPTFRAVARTYGSDLTPMSLKGWKNPYVHLLMPRTGGSIICVEGTSTPFTWRVMCDRAIHSGMNGLGRMGADYFDGTWMDGFRGGEWLLVGRACVRTLWPGPDGVESGARNEAMLEGIQEAEARIFLEQVLDRDVLDKDLAEEVQKVLDDHFRGTLHVAAGGIDYMTMDYHVGWQARSRRLFGAAAKVSRAIGMDVDPACIGGREVRTVQRGRVSKVFSGQGVPLPAMGRETVTVKLRNWTAKPRRWTAATTQPWIRPEKTAGSVSRHEPLAITLDGKDLKPGDTRRGTLTITDVASGTAYPVKIVARVTKPFEFGVAVTVFNVVPGGTDSRKYLLANRTAEAQTWKVAASVPWISAAPASGTLPAGGSVFVKVTARAPGEAAAKRSAALTLTAAGEAFRQKADLTVYAIPAYRAPASPAGEFVYLNQVHKTRLKSFVQVGMDPRRTDTPWWARGMHFHRRIQYGEDLKRGGFDRQSGGPEANWATVPFGMGPPDAKKTFQRGLWVYPRFEATYQVAGGGFAAFAAEVGFHKFFTKHAMANRAAAVNFEIHVDGKLAAQSGLMRPGEPPRRLVADLTGAKEMKLLVRRDTGANDPYCLATWADPRFYKK